MAISSADLAEIESFLYSNQLDKNNVCLVGSITMAHIDIRQNEDIDLIILSSIRKEKFNNNNTIEISKKIDVVRSPWSSIFSDDEIIENENLHSIINGFKVVRPELLYHKKIWLNRLKDRKDVIELAEFAQMSSNWDWALIQSHLPKRNFIKRVSNTISNRLKALVKSVTSFMVFQESNQIIPTNLLLSKQMRNNQFNRYDLVVRYMVIESVLAGNDNNFQLYKQMQEKRGNSPHENPLTAFQNLIESMQKNRFDFKIPIVVNKQLQLIDGAHRFACALYFGTEQIPIKIVKNNTDFLYGKDWFKQANFSDSTIALLETKKKEIFFNNHLFFEVILWPPVSPYFDEIQKDIENKYSILSYETYTNYAGFENYVNVLYEIDDIKKWKVKLKLEAMGKYSSTFRRILIYIPDPEFRYKESNSHLISQNVEQLKHQIREKYAPKIDGYFHDIIIHIGDNFSHTKKSKDLIDA